MLERTICGGQSQAVFRILGVGHNDLAALEQAKTIFAWGINILSTNVHAWPFIERARERGAKLVVVDPYRSRTADRADVHLQIQPGSDGALALGMARVILDEGLADQQYLDAHTTGLAEFREWLEGCSLEWAAGVTGLEAAQIAEAARLYATQTPSAIRLGVGMQRTYGAGHAVWAVACLPALTGSWKHAGGGLSGGTMAFGAINLGELMGFGLLGKGSAALGRMPRRINMLHLGRALLDPDLAPPIKALYVWNSNPAVIAPERGRVLEGLTRDDLFVVVHDQFQTETADFADIILPATTQIEQREVVASWGTNFVGVSDAAISPLGDSKPNAEVTRLLAAKLGLDDPLLAMSDAELADLALGGNTPLGEGLSLERLESERFARLPIDTPHAAGGFAGPDGRFPFHLPEAPEGLGPFPAYTEPPHLGERGEDGLRLITIKRHHSINSSYGSLGILLKHEDCPRLELNPADAEARQVSDGELVRVANHLGDTRFIACLTDRLPRGVVAAPFGFWGKLGPGGAANDLTPADVSDVGEGPTFHDTYVTVTPA
jgi:anaerobic selenocysteine-containing dehydrogenase